MSKVQGLLVAALIAFGLAPAAANADGANNSSFNAQALQQATMVEAALTGLNWNVGDKTTHKMSGGIINGTIDAFVREATETGFWMQQDMTVMGQKQKVEVLINKTTGKVEKLLVNGKEETPPEPGEVEVIETKEDRIKVAAGEFDCIYAKLKNKKDGKIQEAWINPQTVPMGGMLKAIAETQIGKITQELTSFQFAQKAPGR